MKTIAEAFQDLVELVTNVAKVGLVPPQRTTEGVAAMDAQIERLAQEGEEMEPAEVVKISEEIMRICTGLFEGLAQMVQPLVFERIERVQRAVALLEERSAIARTRFSTELASLKGLVANLGEMATERKAETLSAGDFVLEALEALITFDGEMKEFEASMAAFKRRGVEIREKQEVRTQVSAQQILAQLGRPTKVTSKGGRCLEKRLEDARVRAEMKQPKGQKPQPHRRHTA